MTGPGLAGGFGPLRSLDDPALRHNLPSQATSFVGRAAELAELRSLMPGGRGWSRSPGRAGSASPGWRCRWRPRRWTAPATGCGWSSWRRWPNPSWWPAPWPPCSVSARSRDGPMLDTLAEAVGDRYLLVVLDNAEHVLGGAAKLADATDAVLPAGVPAGHQQGAAGHQRGARLPGSPAARPARRSGCPGQLAAFESVQLFAEHAAMHRQGFALDEDNAAAVAAVCVRLDGIPLALELAAARLGSLSVPEISSRLDQRFRLLTGGSRTALPRHQTLRALIDWSYDLLNPEERIVLDRLSVFAGGLDPGGRRSGHLGRRHRGMAGAGPPGRPGRQEPGPSRRDPRFDPLPAAGDGPPVRRRTPCPAGWRRAGRDPRRPPRSLPGPGRDRRHAPARPGRGRMAGPAARPSSTTSAPRWRSASPIPTAPSPACDWRPGCAGSATCAATAAKSSRHSTPCSTDPTPACPPGPGPGPSPRAATCSITSATTRRSPRWPSEAIKIARGLADDAVAADALAQLCWFSFEHGDLPAALAQIDDAVAAGPGSRRSPADCLTFSAVAQCSRAKPAIWTPPSLTTRKPSPCPARPETPTGSPSHWPTSASTSSRPGSFAAARAHLQEASTLADNHGYQHLSAGLRENLGVRQPDGRRSRQRPPPFPRQPGHGPDHRRQGVRSRRAPRPCPGGRRGRQRPPTPLPCTASPMNTTSRPDGHSRPSKRGCATATMPGCAPHWAMPRSRPPTPGAARSAKPTPSRWPPQTVQPEPKAESAATVPAAGQDTVHGSADPLSEREREIVALLAGGATDAQIAERLFLSINTVQIAPGADPGQDRRPPPHRTSPLRHPGRHRPSRPSHLIAGPPWPYMTGLPAVNGPIGPHLGCSTGPSGPCCQAPAGLTLGLLLRHRGGTANQRGRHGINAKNTFNAHPRR